MADLDFVPEVFSKSDRAGSRAKALLKKRQARGYPQGTDTKHLVASIAATGERGEQAWTFSDESQEAAYGRKRLHRRQRVCGRQGSLQQAAIEADLRDMGISAGELAQPFLATPDTSEGELAIAGADSDDWRSPPEQLEALGEDAVCASSTEAAPAEEDQDDELEEEEWTLAGAMEECMIVEANWAMIA